MEWEVILQPGGCPDAVAFILMIQMCVLVIFLLCRRRNVVVAASVKRYVGVAPTCRTGSGCLFRRSRRNTV